MSQSHSSLEVVIRKCSVKKVFLETSQNSQKNNCAIVSFFNKVASGFATLLKTSLWHRCFPLNLVKFLKAPFYIEHLWWLLLSIVVTSLIQLKMITSAFQAGFDRT